MDTARRAPTRFELRFLAAGAGCSLFLLLSCGRVHGQAAERREIESQTREYNISVDGAKRGNCTIQIRNRNDGTVFVRSETEVHMNVVLYKYNYSSAGTEVWKNGRLLSLENTADFNGKRFTVKAASARNGLQLNIDGNRTLIDPDVWVTSYWHIPERIVLSFSDNRTRQAPANREASGVRTVSLLDSDHGAKLQGAVKRFGREVLPLMGTQQACTHYQITGDVQVDLWFDANNCLVRNESVESAHKVRLELGRITGEPRVTSESRLNGE